MNSESENESDRLGTANQHDRHDHFRCEDCGHVQGPPSHRQCEECGGLIREYIPMEGPVYEVDVGGFGPIWFPANEYSGAFQHATGYTIERAGGEHEQESEIRLVDFEGVVEVPVADV